MTHDVVPGDIELATRLIKAGCQDSGIIAELCWRGVGEREAAGLVQALRHGEKVRVTLASGPSRRSGRWHCHIAPADPNQLLPARIRRTHSRGSLGEAGAKPWDPVSVALLVAVTLGLLYLFTADTGIVPGREHLSGPFVPIEDFNRTARGLTNDVAH